MSRPRRPGERNPFIHEYRELLALFPHFRHITCDSYTNMSQSDMDMQSPPPLFREAIKFDPARTQYVELRLTKKEEVVGYTVMNPFLREPFSATGYEIVGHDSSSGKTIRFEQNEVSKSEFDTYALILKAAPVFKIYEVVPYGKFCSGVKVHIPEGVLNRTPSVDKEKSSWLRKKFRDFRRLFQRFR